VAWISDGRVRPADAQQLEDFLDASRAGSWRWELESGEVTWNDRLEVLHGLAPGEFRGCFEHWVELLHPDEVEGILADVQAALAARGAYDLLYRTRFADGSVHWVECRGRVTVDDEGNPTGTIGIAFDVTERKVAEDELRASREEISTIARRLQESLLGPPVLVEGAGHAARYLPAARSLDVGGDWYSAQHRPDGTIIVAVGDVVGKGIDAATVMGQLRSALSAAALRADTAAEAIDTLDAFADSVPGAGAATAVLAMVDLEARTIEYSRAGHTPPMLVLPDGSVELLDGGQGPPLALGLATSWGNAATSFPDGAMLVLYSDGLVERRGESLDVGFERLAQSLQRHWTQPLERLCDRVLDDLFRDAPPRDDVALLLLRSPVVSDRMFLRKVRAVPSAPGAVCAELRRWFEQIGMQAPIADELEQVVLGHCLAATERAADTRAGLFRVEAAIVGAEVVCCVTDAAGAAVATRPAPGSEPEPGSEPAPLNRA
jgi:PAS domain S-box-containing protein